ncbi:MAG: ABC transporter permease [Planctomycetota bacterium]|nr:ABC transporter permease [Planctomycetota bacterium]
MRGWIAITRRELAGLFVGPLAWALLFIAVLLQGWLFVLYLKTSGGDVDLALRWTLGESWVFWALLILVPPLLTMRMISEESRTGILEFLLTAPVSDAAVVLGKFTAAVVFLGLLWSTAFLYGLAVSSLGIAPDWGALAGGWLGAVLCSALFSAIGLCASAMTSTPIVAAFGAIVLNLVFVTAPLLAGLSDQTWVRAAVARVDVIDHHKGSFLAGVLDTSYVAFFAAWTAFFVFVAVRAVEARRWR